jgi:hypothetical protein
VWVVVIELRGGSVRLLLKAGARYAVLKAVALKAAALKDVVLRAVVLRDGARVGVLKVGVRKVADDVMDVATVTVGVGAGMAAAKTAKSVDRVRSAECRAFWAVRPLWFWVADLMSRRRLRRMLRRSGSMRCLRRLREWVGKTRIWVKELRVPMAAAAGGVAVGGVVDVA